MEEREPNSPNSPNSPASGSPRQKPKLSSLCLPSPFRKHHGHHHAAALVSPDKHRLVRTSSPTASWIKSRAQDIPEFKDKCRNFISSIGRNSHGHGHGHRHGHGRRHSADFHYDALSYSLNFDDGSDENGLSEFPLRSFSSRLPPSPNKEIHCS